MLDIHYYASIYDNYCKILYIYETALQYFDANVVIVTISEGTHHLIKL